MCGAANRCVWRATALPGKFKVFESLQFVVAHSGHGASFLETANYSQVSLECHRDGHGSWTAKHSQMKAV